MTDEISHNYLLYIAAFACAFAVSLLLTPVTKRIAAHFGAIDYPRSRGMHKEPVPRMGGMAIVVSFLLTMLVLTPFVEDLRTRQFAGFACGAVIIFLLGMADDVYTLGAKPKLCVQVIAAVVAVASGIRINTSFLPFYGILQPFEIPITVVWIVGLTNAVNLIDGLDGLAAGVSSIGSLCIMALCFLSGGEMALVFSVTLTGATLGFLPRNFNPAEVIMGDTGSTFLGYVLAVSSIIGVFKYYTLLSVVIALLALALPIFDTAFAMTRRAIKGKPIMSPDRGHLHHRLIDSGMSPKTAVVLLWAVSALSAVIAILIAARDYRAVIIVLAALALLSLMVFLYRRRL
ncbi:MAG: undecaprenyl/decaprenyl-phosphate alpha-N-acetylglucosaminyl 1-phosphate transferase [Clostridiales bacterium]|jgi:UDP-GlcNAc:undecaprenyl-phosphate GlcNAc-1-phosphate transferase|nr:undecaprenyl/decaprenyl-phosphate alpha-N-acetylglucosaminyl 1-phosphate transferase [Clostridiales bacterium]